MAVPLIAPSFRQPLPRANVVGVVSFLGGSVGFEGGMKDAQI
jgi:hypothetical protein